MASGSAILCISDGKNDVSRLIAAHGVGVNIKSGDVENLAEAIIELVNDRKRLNAYKHNARATAMEYDIERVTQQYAFLFAELI